MNVLFPELEPEFDAGNNKKYEVEAIIDSVVYAKKAEWHLPDLYYLVFWKSDSEKKNIWEPSFTVMYLWKMISTFHKNHPEKPTATFLLLDYAPPMAKPSVKPAKPSAKQKQGRPMGTMKQVKQWDIEWWGFLFPILVRLEGFFTNFMSFGRDAYWALSSNSAGFQSMSKTLPLCSLSMSSTLPLCLPYMSSILPLCFLSISSTLPPVFWFFFLVSH